MPNEGNPSESAEQSSELNVTAGGNVTTGDHVAGNKIIYNYPPPSITAPSLEDESPAPGVSPFKGLEYFNEADADLFFGREALTAKLAGHLRQHRFLAVVGASGSGKSSLVRAGLVPTLKRGEPLANGILPPEGSTHWPIHVITPTSHPLETLAASLTRDSESVTATSTLIDDLAHDPRSLHLYVRKILSHTPSPAPLARHRKITDGGGSGGGGLLLVVDQFEELFTLCHNGSERQAFVDNLLTAVSPETDGPTIVVLTLRADFYAHCAQFADLREALATQQEYIGPMSADELRRAIEEPAKRGDWNFEEGLVDLLLRDAGAGNEPGALPLLSHALLETWKRRRRPRGRALTLKGYTDSGGVRGAIAKTAETVYQQLTPEQQTIARSIFLRLTELGEDTQDTRRRAALAELIPHPATRDKAAVEAVLKTLADARLITTDEETADVAHEALIREWPTLRRWLDEDREGLQIHRHLTGAAQEWAERNRDESELYRGGRLSAAREWAGLHAGELNALEREFLEASRAREVSELEASKKKAAQLRNLVLYLSAALVVALMMAIYATIFSEQANRNLNVAETAQARSVTQQANAESASTQAVSESNNRATAEAETRQQARIALSRQLAAQAQSRLNDNPQVAVLLALEARRYSQTNETEDILARAPYVYPPLWATLKGHTEPVSSVAWSPDGKRLVSGSWDNTLIIWDAASGQPLMTLKGHTGSVTSVAWSPDGKRLASGSWGGMSIYWDGVLSSRIYDLYSDGNDNAIIIWDTTNGQLLATLKGHTEPVHSVAWSPDGKQLASGSWDNTLIIWDAVSGQPLTTLKGHTGKCQWEWDNSVTSLV